MIGSGPTPVEAHRLAPHVAVCRDHVRDTPTRKNDNRGSREGTSHRLDDDDDKLVVIPAGTAPPGDDAIAAAVEFQEIPGRYRILR